MTYTYKDVDSRYALPMTPERYRQVNHLDTPVNVNQCHFCGTKIKKDKDGWILPSNGEIGEFWSETLQDSVLAHPDCLPNGIDAVFEGSDTEWKMA
jgi:hypothetical protein